MRFLVHLAFALSATLTVACSSSGEGDRTTPPILAEYPPGPYGTEVGDTLPNFALEGFQNGTAEEPTSLDVYGPFDVKSLAERGAKYALIHVSAADSEISEIAAQDLANGGKKVVQKGAQIVEVLARADGTAADRSSLETWIETYGFSVHAAVDSPGSPLTVLDAAGSPESGFIIEMPKMEVIWVAHGTTQYNTVLDGLHWLDSLLEE
jgi:hypothetical protein